ncbi:MAG TPA: TonB-dependent receptor [Candidatus Polarisedimenticolia bacterium]|nr:TonB-dependent receptor [Candidatus Polarisedimenticolia bacterium]
MLQKATATVGLLVLCALPALAFDGQVLLPDGAPAVGATVSITGVEGTTRTNAEGRFHWEPDPTFPCELRVLLAGGQYTAPVRLDSAPAQGTPIKVTPVLSESVTVIATRVPEPSSEVPASVTVVSGEDMVNRGARDLQGALSQAVGLDVAPGGDAGPASSVVEMWGLKEFDAYLLVVDGVPWGGAFNPAMQALDLYDVDHIEVLRGAAPVTYGATSFVGVIEVFKREADDPAKVLSVAGGSYGSYSASYRTPLPGWASVQSALSLDLGQAGYKDDRTEVQRGHLLWKNVVPAGSGKLRFDVDGLWQQQDPASPRVRVGADLAPEVALDTNQNPGGSHIDENRFALNVSYEQPALKGSWTSRFSVAHSSQDILRGFLVDVSTVNPNAHGFRQDTPITDIYLDSHVAFPLARKLQLVTGVDYLYGHGETSGGDFDYFVNLNGDNPPDGEDLASQADIKITDVRNFAGAYGQFRWDPKETWHFELGLRVNYTDESRDASAVEFGSGTTEGGTDSMNLWRGSGYAGVTWTAWHQGAEALYLFADYRNTYKPAVVDFGLEAEDEILNPETAESVEVGVKSRLLDGKLSLEMSAFQMNFHNLVVSQNVGGVPSLENAGSERFRGLEIASAWQIKPALSWRVGYSLHDARFTDYTTQLDPIPAPPTVLDGNQLEMSARNMAFMGFVLAPERAWRGSIQANYVGTRFLNKRNTAPTEAFTTLDAGVGYRYKDLEFRLDGYNLTDQREPVSESELGDAQYYIMPARSLVVGVRWNLGS